MASSCPKPLISIMPLFKLSLGSGFNSESLGYVLQLVFNLLQDLKTSKHILDNDKHKLDIKQQDFDVNTK
jgi:hypothetical protein